MNDYIFFPGASTEVIVESSEICIEDEDSDTEDAN